MRLRQAAGGGDWVLLFYRMPREPSTRRIAVWRQLKRLGVVQVLDGLVALPADARTREQWEWVAEIVEQAGGTAALWAARPDSAVEERRLATAVSGSPTEEYRRLQDAADE